MSDKSNIRVFAIGSCDGFPEILRALVCGRGIVGMLAGPWSAGTTANLLLQAAASGGNGAGTAVHVKAGLGALTRALADAARGFGAEIRTGADVERITTKDGRVTGVVLAGGEEIPARAVASAADPKHTFLRLLDPAVLDPEDLLRLRNWHRAGDEDLCTNQHGGDSCREDMTAR